MDDQTWTVFDAYCGLGGFTCGALLAFKDMEISNLRVVGVDSDKLPLAAFKKNVAAVGVKNVKAICKEIGQDAIEWPEENGRLIVHFSPCCQPFSRARPSVPQSALTDGLNQIKFILDLVISKGYKRWTLEEVSHPEILALIKQYITKYPNQVAVDLIDAVNYGCPSERRRLIATAPSILIDLKGSTTTEFRPPKRAFEEAGIEPASDFYRNGNAACVPRPISRPCFTITASHPIVFCCADKTLVRCMQPCESAALVGFPTDWVLPTGVGAAQRAVGNAVSPMLGRAIAMSEIRMPNRAEPDATIPPSQPIDSEFVTRAEAKALVAAAIAALRTELTAPKS